MGTRKQLLNPPYFVWKENPECFPQWGFLKSVFENYLNMALEENSFTSSSSTKNKRKLEDTESDHSDEESSPAQQRKSQAFVNDIDRNGFIKAKTNKEMVDTKEYLKYKPEGYSINEPPTDRKVRIYADGVFDLFHLG